MSELGSNVSVSSVKLHVFLKKKEFQKRISSLAESKILLSPGEAALKAELLRGQK